MRSKGKTLFKFLDLEFGLRFSNHCSYFLTLYFNVKRIMVQNIFRSSLVHCVIILIWWSYRLPDPSCDQTVAESHPDAFPDVHLDLVVILKTLPLLSPTVYFPPPITGYGGAMTPSNFLRSWVYISCACSRLFFSSSVLAASARISVSASSFRPWNDNL